MFLNFNLVPPPLLLFLDSEIELALNLYEPLTTSHQGDKSVLFKVK